LWDTLNPILIIKTPISVKLELEYEKSNIMLVWQRLSMHRIISLEREWTLPDLLISGGKADR
jgi:hypothetical protein